MEAFTVSYLNRTSNSLLPVGFQSQGKANVIPFSPLFGLLLCWLHQELEGLLSKFRWGCLGTGHWNLLFSLCEGENAFPSQPFLKRSFDLLNPEARVFISSAGPVWALQPFLGHGAGRLPEERCLPGSATQPHRPAPWGRVMAPIAFSRVTLTSLTSHHLMLVHACLNAFYSHIHFWKS